MLCYNQTDNTVIENLYKKLYFCSFQIKADFFYNDTRGWTQAFINKRTNTIITYVFINILSTIRPC